MGTHPAAKGEWDLKGPESLPEPIPRGEKFEYGDDGEAVEIEGPELPLIQFQPNASA